MDINSTKHILVFSCCLGISVFILNAIWGAVFLDAVPQAQDWCRDDPDVQEFYPEGIACLEFKNDLEMAKYYHNVKVRDRNRRWVYGTIALGALAGGLLFRHSRERPGGDSSEGVVLGAALGATAAVLLPLLLSIVVPPPSDWMPSALRRYADSRSSAALERLQERRE